MLVGHVRDQCELPAKIDGAVADAEQDEADPQKPQVRRQQVHQRHQADEHTARGGGGFDEVTAAIQAVAEDQIGQEATHRADQLQHADI